MIEYYLGDTMDYEKWLDTEFDIIKNRVKMIHLSTKLE